MNKQIFETEQDAAGYIVDTIEHILKEKPNGLFCLAAGHSFLVVFEEILKRRLDLSQAKFIGLDDWLGIDPKADGSCARFLRTNFFDASGVKPENLRLFDSLAVDPQAECLAVERQIDDWGGIDYILLGMGMNGHLALNEPGDSFSNDAHVVPLSETTKQVAVKYFSEGMPPITQGITLGIKNIISARKIQLGVFGEHKQKPLEKLLSHQSPDEEFPATALLASKSAELLVDRKAVGL